MSQKPSEAERCPRLVCQVLHFFDCHDPKPEQIRLAKSLLFNISLKLEVPYPHLAEREEECLVLALNHQTAKQIAHILKLSQRTIEDYLENARAKLGCQTTTQAVIEGVRHGLLSISARLEDILFDLNSEEPDDP